MGSATSVTPFICVIQSLARPVLTWKGDMELAKFLVKNVFFMAFITLIFFNSRIHTCSLWKNFLKIQKIEKRERSFLI